MNSIEVRFNGSIPDSNVFDLSIDYIGIGDEGCAYNFIRIFSLDKTYTIINEAKQKNMGIKIIIPFIQERHLEQTKNIVKKLLDLNYDITYVVNDLGIMNYLSRAGNNSTVCLGRFITNSYDMIPWRDIILTSEDEKVKYLYKQINIAHPLKMEFYKLKQVSEIEINISHLNMDSIIDLKQNNMKINAHHNVNIFAFTRACPVRRFYGLDEKSCFTKCSKEISIKVDKMWGATGMFDLHDTVTLPGIIVHGNKMLLANRLTQEELKAIDCLIFDSFAYPDFNSMKDSLESVIYNANIQRKEVPL